MAGSFFLSKQKVGECFMLWREPQQWSGALGGHVPWTSYRRLQHPANKHRSSPSPTHTCLILTVKRIAECFVFLIKNKNVYARAQDSTLLCYLCVCACVCDIYFKEAVLCGFPMSYWKRFPAICKEAILIAYYLHDNIV